MNIRCNYCGNSFNVGRDYLVQAVAEAKEKKQKYHAFECNNCRKMVKVPVNQMSRFLPKVTEESEGDQG
jgi:hypothetical protein